MSQVVIAMGSDSDLPVMEKAGQALDLFGIKYDMRILSAHRTPHRVIEFSKHARRDGVRVVIAGAGGAAHLPGMIASHCALPVIGVPVPLGSLGGEDALLSIVQMPQDVPVATMAIGNAWNAGILAAQILAAGTSPEDQDIFDKIIRYKENLESSYQGFSVIKS
ncbi:MAG: 5-(carboxyamino)imidazole ribonucleotide mutase [Deltaproteobacteria bacterium]|nr:MAG: 5-(carboxyamino)imidazole ribonucleotide mutase [Deltaproteobacteria bacterium]